MSEIQDYQGLVIYNNQTRKICFKFYRENIRIYRRIIGSIDETTTHDFVEYLSVYWYMKNQTFQFSQ